MPDAPDQVLSYAALRKQPRPSLAAQLPLSAPLSIYLEPTNVCNFRCKQCPQALPDYKEQAGYYTGMSFELYEKIVRDIKALGRLVSLKLYFLGEPLVNKRLVDMIKLARAEDICERIEITSNGSLLTEANARALVTSGLDYLRISIYAMDQERQEHVTQTRVSVDRIRENLVRFQAIKRELGLQKPVLYVKMIQPHPDEAERFGAIYREIADEVEIESAMNWNGDGDFLSPLYGESPPEELPPGAHKEVCPFAFYSLVITASGEVVVCCVDWNLKTKVGDLRHESLAAVWNGRAMQDFRLMQLERRRHENPSCRDCTFLHTSPDNLDQLSRADAGCMVPGAGCH